MTNSYKSYSTTLEKINQREKHAERRDFLERKENEKRKEWIKEMKMREEGTGICEGIGGA